MSLTTTTLAKIVEDIETWLTTGNINPEILAENFKFFSPFWEGNNKAEFLDKFLDPTTYIKNSLSKITKFDPIIKLKNMSDDNGFAIVLQYHTKNGSQVYETVLGIVKEGKLIELRSVYDLNSTKKALEL